MPQPTGHKWFAAFWDIMTRLESATERGARQEVAGGASGRILEISCGNGANFPYYPETAELLATDPDPHMLERARKRATETARTIDLRRAPAEELPFADGSFDTVVSTLVLCSVPDQLTALAEIRRVLKPAGQLRFFEHVRYKNHLGAFFQDAVTPVWSWMGAGCHPNRDTAASMEDSSSPRSRPSARYRQCLR